MEQTINNLNETSEYETLSIQVSLNGLSFCAIDSDNVITDIAEEDFGILLSPEQLLEKLKIIFSTHPLLKKDFNTLEVIYHNDLYTLVPFALFDKDHLKEYLQYSNKVFDHDFIAHDELLHGDMVTVFIPYANINNYFFENFGSFTYQHTMSVLLNIILLQEKNSETTRVYAHLHKKSFDLVIMQSGKLLLGNTFPFENEEDFLYYVLFSTEQFRLNPEEFELIFSGNIVENDVNYKMAYTYIRNISFARGNGKYQLSPHLNLKNQHQHFMLFNQL